ncbi:MAG: hypothetical protein AB1589_33875 [Cyanobacteriota bacterium]
MRLHCILLLTIPSQMRSQTKIAPLVLNPENLALERDRCLKMPYC